MDKVAKQSLKSFVILAVIASVLLVSYALASYTASVGGGKNNSVEDVSYAYNITVNNTDAGDDSNITSVYVLLPSNFVYINATNATSNSGAGMTFSNYTNSTGQVLLTWRKGAGIVPPDAVKHGFEFNATATNPGYYNFSVWFTNATGNTSTTLVSIQVNDTTVPEYVRLNDPQTNGTGTPRVNITQGPMHVIKFSVNGSDPWFNGTIRVFLMKRVGANYIVVNNATTTDNTEFASYFGGNSNGDYKINASFNDTYGNINWTSSEGLVGGTANITLNDSTKPEPIIFEAPTNATGSNSTNNWIFVNVSVGNASSHTEGYEQNIANATWRLYNLTTNASGQFTSLLLVNSTVTGNGTRFFNWTNLNDGNYTYNVTFVDYGSNVNASENRNITIDATAPSVTLTKEETNTDKNTVEIGIAIAEGGTGVSGVCTSASYSDISITGTGKVQTLVYGSDNLLSCGTTYTFSVSCKDYAGNTGTSTLAVTTDACGGGGSDSGGPGSSSSDWDTTYTITTDQFEEGYTKEVAADERVEIPVTSSTGGVSTHHVGVKEVGTTTITIEVSSTPQTATLSIGDTRKFDVIGDGWYDIQVTLNSIANSKADLIILAIHDPVTTEAEAEQQEQEEAAGEEAGATPPTPPPEEPTTTGKFKIVWILLILAIIAVVVVVVVKGSKKKKNRK